MENNALQVRTETRSLGAPGRKNTLPLSKQVAPGLESTLKNAREYKEENVLSFQGRVHLTQILIPWKGMANSDIFGVNLLFKKW